MEFDGSGKEDGKYGRNQVKQKTGIQICSFHICRYRAVCREPSGGIRGISKDGKIQKQ